MGDISLQQAFIETTIINRANPSSQARLAASGRLCEYKKGQHIFRDKEPVAGIYFLIRGIVHFYKIDSMAEKKVIFVYGKGTLLNEDIFGQLKASVSCEVKETALVLFFPHTAFCQVMSQDFLLCQAVMEAQTNRTRRLYRQLKNTSNSLRVDKKIAAKLWKLARDYGRTEQQGVVIDLPISITYLSDMLAVKRETVSRQIKQLTAAGLIAYRCNKFYIPDIEVLGEYFKSN